MHLDLVGTWLSDACTLTEWVRRFGLIESKLEVDQVNPITSKDIKEEETIQQNALALLTSRKRKAPVSRSPQQKLMYNGELNLSQDPEVPVPNATLQAALTNMNKGITAVTSEVGIIADNLSILQATSDSTVLTCDQKVKDVEAHIGTKPDFLDEDFDGPTIWLTITQVAAQLSHITSDLDRRIVSQINQLRPMIELDGVKLFQQEIIGVHNRMDVLKDQLVKLAKSLKANAAFGNEALTPSRNNLSSSRFSLTPGADERISKLEEEIKLLKAINDSDAIRFLSLGFKSREEASAWIALHYNFDSFGYIIDAHILFEHLYAAILKDGDDSLTKNVTLAKNKLYTAYEAMVMTSYGRKAPKLFRENKKHRVVTNLDSYFDVIPNHKDWKAYETSFRSRILSELREVKDSYMPHINSDLDNSTLLYRVAYQSLIFSVSWVEDFVHYIDEVFEEYTESKFDHR